MVSYASTSAVITDSITSLKKKVNPNKIDVSNLCEKSSHYSCLFHVMGNHYENMPMQYKEIFKVVKNENFQLKTFDNFLIFAKNLDCGYLSEPPCQGGSSLYPQSMF